MSKAPAEQLRELQAELEYLNPIIGGWPTQIQNVFQGWIIKRRWKKARKIADSLAKGHPIELDAQLAHAELLRMGHNIDIPRAAEECVAILHPIIQQHPNNFQAHYSLACLYVTIHQSYAPQAEEHFLIAERLLQPAINPEIYQGLGFACVYQQKISEAIKHFEHYLEVKGRVPQIMEIVTHLKSGEQPQIH
jgi:tetratricopeptide (TPR) repeat protein